MNTNVVIHVWLDSHSFYLSQNNNKKRQKRQKPISFSPSRLEAEVVMEVWRIISDLCRTSTCTAVVITQSNIPNSLSPKLERQSEEQHSSLLKENNIDAHNQLPPGPLCSSCSLLRCD